MVIENPESLIQFNNKNAPEFKNLKSVNNRQTRSKGFLAIRTGWLIDDSGQSIGLELATKTKTYDSILGMDHGKQNKSDDYIIKRTFSWLS